MAPNTSEAEAGRHQVQSFPGLKSEFKANSDNSVKSCHENTKYRRKRLGCGSIVEEGCSSLTTEKMRRGKESGEGFNYFQVSYSY